MEGGHAVVVFHDMGNFIHDTAGYDRRHFVHPVGKNKLIVHALKRKPEPVQTHQAQLVACHLHQAAGERLAAFLKGNGKRNLRNHIAKALLGKMQRVRIGQVFHLRKIRRRHSRDGRAALTAADGNHHPVIHGKVNRSFRQLAHDFREQTAGQYHLSGI